MMYLVEGRNQHETRGQYVLSIDAAQAVFREMQSDFYKVSIYKKVKGEYTRIEKWERPLTHKDFFRTANTDELADEIYELVCCSNELLQRILRADEQKEEGALELIKEWLREKRCES